MALFNYRLVLAASVILFISAVEGRAGIQDNLSDDKLHFEANLVRQAIGAEDIPNAAYPATFQRCMLDCIDPDLCCSCKESGKRSMMAALVNALTKECSSSDIAACTKQWTMTTLEAAISEGGASNCTSIQTTSVSLQQCATSCMNQPFSKPLNPYRPSAHPGALETEAELSRLASVDLTDFCQDVRAEGLLCSSYRADSYTAGNTLCRGGTRCGHHGYKYSWCYVDYSNNWDYCCTGDCGYASGTRYMWCWSGPKWQYCGKGGDVGVKGRRCVASYPCGMHQEKGRASYYWCYTDAHKNWERCCEPDYPCKAYHRTCPTGYKKLTQQKECVP